MSGVNGRHSSSSGVDIPDNFDDEEGEDGAGADSSGDNDNVDVVLGATEASVPTMFYSSNMKMKGLLGLGLIFILLFCSGIGGIVSYNKEAPPHDIVSNAAASIAETLCVCSPLSYTFTIDLSQDCTNIGSAPGGSASCTSGPISGIDGLESSDLTQAADFEVTLAAESADTLIVYDVQLLEFDSSGSFSIINQDDTYGDVSLTSGDTVTFNSISANLNPDEPVSEQLDYVPGGVLLSLRARTVVEGIETIYENQVAWSYSNACDRLPTSVGDEIGWITLVS